VTRARRSCEGGVRPETRKASRSKPEALYVERKNPGNVLLSHQVALTVPSALEGLTAVFGMGTGVTPPPWSPG
jgi:hypothetical protein